MIFFFFSNVIFCCFQQPRSNVRVMRHQIWLLSPNAQTCPYVHSHTYARVCALRWRRSTKGKHTLGLSSTGSTATCSPISSNDNTDLSRIGITDFPVARLWRPRLLLYGDRWWTSSLLRWGICGCAPTLCLLLSRIGWLLCTHDSTSSEPVFLYEEQKQRDKEFTAPKEYTRLIVVWP